MSRNSSFEKRSLSSLPLFIKSLLFYFYYNTSYKSNFLFKTTNRSLAVWLGSGVIESLFADDALAFGGDGWGATFTESAGDNDLGGHNGLLYFRLWHRPFPPYIIKSQYKNVHNSFIYCIIFSIFIPLEPFSRNVYPLKF